MALRVFAHYFADTDGVRSSGKRLDEVCPALFYRVRVTSPFAPNP